MAEKYDTIELNDTAIIPTPIWAGPDFEERLREVVDVDELIRKDNAWLKEIADKRLPLPAKDLSKKDGDLISKMNLLA